MKYIFSGAQWPRIKRVGRPKALYSASRVARNQGSQGNELALTLAAEKELLKFKRGIDKLLPEQARKELGIHPAGATD
jgi:hypothetical protein